MLYSFHLIAFNVKAKVEPTCLAREKIPISAKRLTSRSCSSPRETCWELGWGASSSYKDGCACAYLGVWSFSATLDGNSIPSLPEFMSKILLIARHPRTHLSAALRVCSALGDGMSATVPVSHPTDLIPGEGTPGDRIKGLLCISFSLLSSLL